jgi:hypothetical protein
MSYGFLHCAARTGGLRSRGCTAAVAAGLVLAVSAACGNGWPAARLGAWPAPPPTAAPETGPACAGNFIRPGETGYIWIPAVG